MSLVSCIVTTCGRPELVGTAIASVLAQTHVDLELVVVVDGAEPATERMLAGITDSRLRVVVRPTRGGQGRGINTGVAVARGSVTALLDDDDVWLPEKLAHQRAAAPAAGAAAIVGCRFLARSEHGDVVWPRRAPDPGERLAEWIFCRRQLRFGEGIMPTSMLYAPTALFRAVPMAEDLRRHCDLDWLIRADQRAGVRFVLPTESRPLAIWEMQSGRQRMSNAPDWRDSLAWIDARRTLVGPRAYAGFVLTWISESARRTGDFGAFGVLVRAAFRNGRPSLRELLVHAAIWVVPPRARAARQRGAGAEVTP